MDRRVAKYTVNKRLKLQNQNMYPIFCDLSAVQNIQREARDYFAEEGSLMSKALAILVKDDYSMAITEFYVRVSRPQYPTKVFLSKEKALKFLEPFK